MKGIVKFEFHGRWLRFSFELFPGRKQPPRIRYEPPRKALAMRRRLMRQIQAELNPPITST